MISLDEWILLLKNMLHIGLLSILVPLNFSNKLYTFIVPSFLFCPRPTWWIFVGNSWHERKHPPKRIYAVVQAGTDIGFFEYHSYLSNLEENNIPNFRGFVSLTQDYLIEKRMTWVLFNKPSDLKNLFYNFEQLRVTNEVRTGAINYPIPCIFNLENHQQEVHFLFQHMEKNAARSSW